MKFVAIGFVILGFPWLASHFHYYSFSSLVWNLGIDVHLVYGSFWTDVHYYENPYRVGGPPIWVAFDSTDYDLADSASAMDSASVIQPEIRETILGKTLFEIKGGLPDLYVSISVSLWLVLLFWCIAVLLLKREWRRKPKQRSP
ncbi:MAG: hypothetical protein AAGC68_02925 [Verrucomicrobiota bacterium]